MPLEVVRVLPLGLVKGPRLTVAAPPALNIVIEFLCRAFTINVGVAAHVTLNGRILLKL